MARPAPLGEVVVVEVSVDGGAHPAVNVEGRVVHREETETGEEAEGNLLSGMGLQLTDVARSIERLRRLLGE